MSRDREQVTALAGVGFERDWAQVAMEKTGRNCRHFPLYAARHCQLVRQPAVESHAVGMGDREQAARPMGAHEKAPSMLSEWSKSWQGIMEAEYRALNRLPASGSKQRAAVS